MHPFIRSIVKVTGGRLARNIYFWLAVFATRRDYTYTPIQLAISSVLFILLMILFYANNLLLIPKLFSKKKYTSYTALYAGLVLIIALAYTGVLKWMLHVHPGIHPGSVSPLVMQSETGTLSLASLIREMVPYYAVLFIEGCVFAMCWFVNNYQRMQHRMEAADKKHLQTELNFLKSQINPHFLFNTLNNLYALTLQKSEQAPDVVAQLSAILRYLLYESDTAAVCVEKEKENDAGVHRTGNATHNQQEKHPFPDRNRPGLYYTATFVGACSGKCV